MTKSLWINLPVKDTSKSKAFFSSLGFTLNEKQSIGDEFACFFIGEHKAVLMLIQESSFEKFTQHKLADTKTGTEVLFSIDAESRAEVDEMAKKAELAGGTVFGKPGDHHGWMYGCGFSDLDGHRWNVLYMDMSKMPKS
jgi:predicted lactoylglutathione lyase